MVRLNIRIPYKEGKPVDILREILDKSIYMQDTKVNAGLGETGSIVITIGEDTTRIKEFDLRLIDILGG